MCAYSCILGAFWVLSEFLFRYRFLIGFESLLGRSWALLGRSWGGLGEVLGGSSGVLAAKTDQERGEREF